jgi:signal transduction histidine kinase
MDDAVAADLIRVSKIDAVPSILKIVCEMTGLRFAAVARVTDASWIACAVRDEISFGLAAGGTLELQSTICDEIRCSGNGVVIDHVADDPVFRDHHTPQRYGFQSYISMPICTEEGGFFGTLCALDPFPAKLSNPAVTASFKGFAQLIGLQLDAQDRLAKAEAAVSQADRTGGMREQFIAILGHDLRNPVAAIQAGTALLAKSPLDSRSRDIVTRMTESAHRIADLIDDLLDFARGRLGAGLVLKTKVATNLAVSIEQVISEIQVVHPTREIAVQIALSEPVTCDSERVSQLLSNLLANALTHGEADAPVIVSATNDDGMFVLSVENQGEPISQASMAELFQPFTQGPNGDRAAGLGLGLFISSEIAKAHGGSLTAVSDDRVTRFILAIPSRY